MATVAKSWIQTWCPKCACTSVFQVTDRWVLVCGACGTQRTLEKTGIVAA